MKLTSKIKDEAERIIKVKTAESYTCGNPFLQQIARASLKECGFYAATINKQKTLIILESK